jgi:hypothetical protein
MVPPSKSRRTHELLFPLALVLVGPAASLALELSPRNLDRIERSRSIRIVYAAGVRKRRFDVLFSPGEIVFSLPNSALQCETAAATTDPLDRKAIWSRWRTVVD